MKRLQIRKPRPSKVKNNQTPKTKKRAFALSMSLLVILGLGLFGGSGYYWYKNSFTDPDRLLSEMLDKSMQTRSVYRTLLSSNGINKSEEKVFIAFSPNIGVQSITTLEEFSQTGKTTAKIEKIGDKNNDYVRYNKIDITASNGPQPDFKQVLGVWGKRAGDPQTGQSAAFLNDAVFTAVPFGNLTPSQRREMQQEIKRVDLYKYTEAKQQTINGRPIMTYSIDINPKALVQVLAKYVEVTNLGSGAPLDPSSYEDAQDVGIRINVDMISRHLESIEFLNTDRTEKYSGYNAFHEINTPTQTISVNELQERLNATQQQQPQPQTQTQ
jgi:hypothetical protein